MKPPVMRGWKQNGNGRTKGVRSVPMRGQDEYGTNDRRERNVTRHIRHTNDITNTEL